MISGRVMRGSRAGFDLNLNCSPPHPKRGCRVMQNCAATATSINTPTGDLDAHPSLFPFSVMSESIPIHPVAPRLANGLKIPHIGPHIEAYRAAHKETVGHESDQWWAKVCVALLLGEWSTDVTYRWLAIRYTGTGPSIPYVLEASRPATSFGSLRVGSTLPTTASTAGHSSILIRYDDSAPVLHIICLGVFPDGYHLRSRRARRGT